MSIITITTPFNIDLEFKLATFGKRLLAWLTDIVVIILYFYFILRVLLPLLSSDEGAATASILFLVVLPVILYQLLCEIFLNGQTLGKKITGIRVIDREGNEPGWSQYLTRWMLSLGNFFIYLIPVFIVYQPAALFSFLVFYIPDFFCMILTPKSQRVGDLAAGTVVIDAKYRHDITETIHLDVADDNYVPMFPQVMRLTDKDINGIRNLLKTRNPSNDTIKYMFEVADRIKAVLNIDTTLHPQDLLAQLLKDYNYLTIVPKTDR